VRTFQAVEHRLEFVRKVSGIDFYNDSKATSVDATLKALDAFPGGLWVILGGKDKGLDYTALREPLAAKAHAALLIGAAAPRRSPAACAAPLPLVESGTLEAADSLRYRTAARRHGAAGAGLRQLRPVPQLRTSRRGVQADREPTRARN
jgi:UDP-N-acetylmuramoylalanine--D-glutamate ligase